MFTAKPNSGKDINNYGFKGDFFDKASKNDIKIAFLGGSTGYWGEPPIANLLEEELSKRLNKKVFVANMSVVSSNHRQHMHFILEYLPKFNPDIVIFYGGYNETVQNYVYDPRPGYPFNFYYRNELPTYKKILVEYSALFGTLEYKYNLISNLNKLREQENIYSDTWKNKVVENYFQTLELSKKVTETIDSNYFGKTKFYAFYQPYRVPAEFMKMDNKIKEKAKETDYLYDVSDTYKPLGEKIWGDEVHVTQEANEVMAKKIADILEKKLKEKK